MSELPATYQSTTAVGTSRVTPQELAARLAALAPREVPRFLVEGMGISDVVELVAMIDLVDSARDEATRRRDKQRRERVASSRQSETSEP